MKRDRDGYCREGDGIVRIAEGSRTDGIEAGRGTVADLVAEKAADEVDDDGEHDEHREHHQQHGHPVLESEAAVLGELTAALEVEEGVGLGTRLTHDRHRARESRRPDDEGLHLLDLLDKVRVRGDESCHREHEQKRETRHRERKRGRSE
ncbi:hypothetical protein PMAYCL1PPCAC_26090, partial [Pristionchus mayeri]